MSLRCRSAVSLLSLCCSSDIGPLTLMLLQLSLCCRSCYCSCCRCCCHSDVALLLLLSLRCHCCCCYCCCAVTPAIAPAVTTLPLLLSLRCRSAVAPLSLRYRSAVAPLLLRYQSAVSPLLVRWRCCHSWCRSAVAPAVASTVSPADAWIFHGLLLKRQNQGNSCHRWLSGACVFLPIAEFDIVENSQGGNLMTLYSSIERSWLSLWLHLTLPKFLLLLHCHSWCHYTFATVVAWIVHGRRLKSHNQGNGCHWWLSGACVFLHIVVFDIIENSQGGTLITLYSSIDRS